MRSKKPALAFILMAVLSVTANAQQYAPKVILAQKSLTMAEG